MRFDGIGGGNRLTVRGGPVALRRLLLQAPMMGRDPEQMDDSPAAVGQTLSADNDRHPADGAGRRSVDLWSDGRARFIVTVDTEEEFDWAAPFSRDRHGTTHVAAIAPFQSICDAAGVVPIYLVDWPIVVDPVAASLIGGWCAAGKADVGAQLHPWVNPPFDEQVNSANSYTANLPVALQRAKLEELVAAIARQLGVRPRIYRAGRYGVGPHTPAMLADCGIALDTSVRSGFDYRRGHGPDFSQSPLTPYWLIDGKVAELPVTTLFGGVLRQWARTIFPLLTPRLSAAAARLGLVERIALTPEGIPVDRALAAIDLAIEARLPLLTFSFHSPSLAVGHTPYVRTQADLDRFYLWWDKVFARLSERGIAPASLTDLLAATGVAVTEPACQPPPPSANAPAGGACSSVG